MRQRLRTVRTSIHGNFALSRHWQVRDPALERLQKSYVDIMTSMYSSILNSILNSVRGVYIPHPPFLK